MTVDPDNLNEVLDQPINVQVAVIATRQFHDSKKLNTLCGKVDGLVAWKIKVTAYVGITGAIVGAVVGVATKYGGQILALLS